MIQTAHHHSSAGMPAAPAVPRGPIQSLALSGRLLLALSEHVRPKAGLVRAAEFARVQRRRFHVLRVLPSRPQIRALLSRRSSPPAVDAWHTSTLERVTRSWVDSLPAHEELVEEIAIAHGDFTQQAAAYAARIGASMIIVSPYDVRNGGLVTSLARASDLPVLVARPGSTDATIVAATDLENAGYPVLVKAAELGEQLDASVVALHNVVPVDGPTHSHEQIRVARSEQLRSVSGRLHALAGHVVRHEPDAVEAILREARKRSADLVVVGTRRRTGMQRWLSRSVAAQVAHRANHSVLVLPLDRGTAHAPSV